VNCPLVRPRALCYHPGMKGQFIQLIVLLVLFFVLPTLFKLLGQYTLGSKGQVKSEPGEDMEAGPQSPRDEVPGHPERVGPPGSPAAGPRQGALSNKPIRPRWF
jgi:hypothetical protein